MSPEQIDRFCKYVILTIGASAVLLVLAFALLFGVKRAQATAMSSAQNNTPCYKQILPGYNLDHIQLFLKEEAKRQGLDDKGAEILRRIACPESGWNHYRPNGSVKVNFGGYVGIYQIGQIHRKRAQSMGWDIYKPEGNVAYAVFLYKTQGTVPWKSSFGKF